MKKFTSPCLLLLFVFMTLMALSSCEDRAEKVAVNPGYEMNPPIADSVYVQRLENDNEHILLVAEFPKDKLEEKYLAINNGDEKIVLRDDGKGGDLKAGDRLYSAKIKVSDDEVTNLLKQQKQVIADAKGDVIHFDGRGMEIIKIPFEKINSEDFDNGKQIRMYDVFPPPPVELRSNSLMVTAISVVEDPARTWNFCTQTGNLDGAWSFGTLMRQLASRDTLHLATDAEVSAFVLSWLNNYANDIRVNGDLVTARRFVTDGITQPWLTRSAQTPNYPPNQLDMRFAPFKLTAIVNRLDLRGNGGYGFSNAGEGRFVFCVIITQSNGDCVINPATGTGAANLFNLILEFGINKTSFSSVQSFAREWYNLKDIALGSTDYNAALQHITDQFTLCGTNPNKPNQSSLNQLRTNEAASTGGLWELREFHIDGTTHVIKQVSVTNEPPERFNAKIDIGDIRAFAAQFQNSEAEIIHGTADISKLFGLGGKAHIGGVQFGSVPNGAIDLNTHEPHHWDGGPSGTLSFIRNANARQRFSLNTCSGCHAGETQTNFTQISPAFFRTEATLSAFLTGRRGDVEHPEGNIIPIDGAIDEDGDDYNGMFRAPDPAGRNSDAHFRQFNDLQRRAIDLEGLVNCGNLCRIVTDITSAPLLMAH